MSQYPVRGEHYTFSQMSCLTLGDNPFLMFRDCDQEMVVQDEGRVPEGLVWRYSYTTNESIPVFYAVDNSMVVEVIKAYRQYDSIYFVWEIPQDIDGIEELSYLEAIQELVAKEEMEKNKEVCCPHCKRTVKNDQLRTWRWYDFYAAQGDEELVLCNVCWNEDRHQARIAKDKSDYEWEFGGGSNEEDDDY